MNDNLISAFELLEKEKGIKREVLVDTIQTALISAYKKNYNTEGQISVDLDEETGDIHVYAEKDVVEEVENENSQISLEEAKKENEAYEVGDSFKIEVTPKSFGRIAAQTAKQVIVQRLREAERDVVYEEYAERVNEIVTGVVQKTDRSGAIVEIGRAEALLPAQEMLPNERLNINDKVKVFIFEVKRAVKGPQITVSRTHPGLVKRLFEIEVPEIAKNVVLIKSIAREAGQRTKIAVYSADEHVDAVGACVGQKKTRIEHIVEELNDEKIDIILWSADPMEFIANALRPAKVIMVQINETEHAAKVIVPDSQLSLAIGRDGQNVRLAAKLTGWKIDIKNQQALEELYKNKQEDEEETEEELEEELEEIEEEIEEDVDLSEDDVETEEEDDTSKTE
ncbi:MAG: transcription termination factor NusA [Eubacteriales bacterium]